MASPFSRSDTGDPTVTALLGLPEADGAVPFLVAVAGPGDAAVVAGTVTAHGLVDPDAGELPTARLADVLERVRADGSLVAVPAHGVVHFLLHATEAPEVAFLLSRLTPGTRNAAQVLDPLRGEAARLDVDALGADTSLLREGDQRVVFGLLPERADAALRPVLSALGAAGGPAARRDALAVVIDETADAALDAGDGRARWTFALDTLTWRARATGDAALAAGARQTALAIGGGQPGRSIPFVRGWVERQLAHLAQSALGAGRR